MTQFVNSRDAIQTRPAQSAPTQPYKNQPVLRSEENSVVTFQPQGQHVVGQEERIEYRDQDGNLLNDEQVISLQKEGKVSFQTRYETRTRLINAEGREL